MHSVVFRKIKQRIVEGEKKRATIQSRQYIIKNDLVV